MVTAVRPEYEIVDENLRSAMRFFGQATEEGEVIEESGLAIISSGLDYGVFNLAMLAGPVPRDQHAIERSLEIPGRHFHARGLHWSFWLCEDRIDLLQRRRFRSLFIEYGFRQINHPPGMYAGALLPPARMLPAIDCRKVTDEATRRAFADISSITFDIPASISRCVYGYERAWQGDFTGFVGYVGETPVATVATVVAAGAVGIYSLGTLPGYRRRGYGEALMRAALARAYRETGIERTILQSTAAGLSLYRRMGYRSVTSYVVYLLE